MRITEGRLTRKLLTVEAAKTIMPLTVTAMAIWISPSCVTWGKVDPAEGWMNGGISAAYINAIFGFSRFVTSPIMNRRRGEWGGSSRASKGETPLGLSMFQAR